MDDGPAQHGPGWHRAQYIKSELAKRSRHSDIYMDSFDLIFWSASFSVGTMAQPYTTHADRQISPHPPPSLDAPYGAGI